MRLKLNVTIEENIGDILKFYQHYYTAINSYIYRTLIKYDNKYKKLHDEQKLKPFTFSKLIRKKGYDNLNLLKGDSFDLVISSGDNNLVNILYNHIVHVDHRIPLGGYPDLFVKEYNIDTIVIETTSCCIHTFLIVVNQMTENGIKTLIYSENPKLYLSELSKNLVERYNIYNKDKYPPNYNIFDKNVEIIVKGVKDKYVIPLHLNKDKPFHAVGTKFVFKLKNIDEMQRKLFQYSIDSGFGVQNAFGMGFAWIVKKKKK